MVYGWWRVSVSCDNLKKMENIQKELEKEKGVKVSFNGVIGVLIHAYRSKRDD